MTKKTKSEYYADSMHEANKNFLTSIVTGLEFPLDDKDMLDFNNKYKKMNPQEKYEIFKNFFDSELSFYKTKLDMGWLGFFVNDLNLSSGSNGVKEGGDLFFYDILQACDFEPEIIKLLVTYFDLNEDCQYSLLSTLQKKYDIGDKVIEILTIMKDNEIDNLDIFPTTTYYQLTEVMSAPYLSNEVMNHDLLKDIDLNYPKFHNLVIEELNNGLQGFDRLINKKIRKDFLDGTELNNINETINNFLKYVNEYNVDTKVLFENKKDINNLLKNIYMVDVFNCINTKESKDNNNYNIDTESSEWTVHLLDVFHLNKTVKTNKDNHTTKFINLLNLANQEKNVLEILEQYRNNICGAEGVAEKEKNLKIIDLNFLLLLETDVVSSINKRKIKV